MSSLIDIPLVAVHRWRQLSGYERNQGFGEEPQAIQFLNRYPDNSDLLPVALGAHGGFRVSFHSAFEDDLELVEMAMILGKPMVFADVFAHVEEFSDLDIHSQFLAAFATEPLLEGFPVPLSAAR